MKRTDSFVEAFGKAVSDVREKLVEEPWFGRPVTKGHEGTRSMAEALGWEEPKARDVQRTHDEEQDHEHDREHGHDIDR